MKKALSFLIAVVILLAAAAPAAAAPSGVTYESKAVTAYLYSKDKTQVMTCLFRADLPTVPFINAVDYLDQLYTVEFACNQNPDGTYTVSDPNGKMIIDVDKDTIYFDDYEGFAESDSLPLTEDETADYLQDGDYVVLNDVNEVTLELGNYDIDLVGYQGAVYFPLTTINDIFAGIYHSALYFDGKLYFNEVLADEPYYDDSALFDTVQRDKALITYNYNELCFTMDYFYGCPPKSRLADMIREKGFDRTLEEYDATTARAKKMLLSEDMVDYLYGMLYLDKYLSDGGHTVLSYGMQVGINEYPTSAFAAAFYASAYDISDTRLRVVADYFQQATEDQQSADDLERMRKKAFASIKKVKEWDDAAFYLDGDVAIFSFDEFKDAVVEPLKWSLDYAQDNGIKNFVIDLTCNGGGSTAVTVYITAMLCDFKRMDFSGQLTGNRYYYVEEVDKNLDGEFDEKDDEVKYDMNFAVLASEQSFSAANMLACLLQYNGIPVIGETTGGGTCAVTMHNDAAGYGYVLSDITLMTYPDGKDVDSGAKPDVQLPGRRSDYVGFFDFAKIGESIEEYYSTRPEPTARPDETTAPGDPGAPSVISPIPDTVVWIAPACVLGVFLIVFVVVLVGNRKQKPKY